MSELNLIGAALIILGIAFVLIPALGQHLKFDELPSWIIYVYNSENFYFATSPLLILISALILILRLAAR